LPFRDCVKALRAVVAKGELAEPPAFVRPKEVHPQKADPLQEGDLPVAQEGDLEGVSKWTEELFYRQPLGYSH
jgi:hypothetical protein